MPPVRSGERAVVSDIAFAEFIDRVTAAFRDSAAYRRALKSEAPGSSIRRDVCPPWHKHGATLTCYLAHRCGCAECRAEVNRRGRVARRRRAYSSWNTNKGKTA